MAITKSNTTLLILATVFSVPAMAGEFSAGAGVNFFESPYKDFSDDKQAFPYLKYQGEGWDVSVEGINYQLLGSEKSPLSVSATLTSAGAGFDEDDSTHFQGLSDRDSSIDLGLSAEYKVAGGKLSGQILGDVSSTHDGFSMDFNYSRNVQLAGGFFRPMVGIEVQSSDFTDYYYGVKSSEAKAGRAAYDADTAVNTYVGYSYVYPVSEQLSVVHSTRYTWLSDEIADSSLVDRDNTWSTALALSYRF